MNKQHSHFHAKLFYIHILVKTFLYHILFFFVFIYFKIQSERGEDTDFFVMMMKWMDSFFFFHFICELFHPYFIFKEFMQQAIWFGGLLTVWM